MKAVLRYLGAKNRLADWIVSFFPDHKIYVEPYGGSAAVLLNKAPVEIEVYNDLYDDVVNLFRIIRSDRYVELMEQVNMTPFSEREYELAARDKSGDELERARKFLVCSFMAVSCDGMFRKTGFRRDRNASCGRVVGKWQRLPDLLAEAHVRLSGVTIRKQDALDIIREYDSPDTLFYLDPPYMHETRTKDGRYAFEYDHGDHERLLSLVAGLQGKVVLSGYDNDLYASMLPGWRVEQKATESMRRSQRIECLWMNYNPQLTLF